MTRWLIRWGIAKNEEQASIILVIISTIVIIFSVYLAYSSLRTPPPAQENDVFALSQ